MCVFEYIYIYDICIYVVYIYDDDGNLKKHWWGAGGVCFEYMYIYDIYIWYIYI